MHDVLGALWSPRLITAEFTATSGVSGGTGGGIQYCSVRIVTRKSGSNTLSELCPRGISVFDSLNQSSEDFSEAHAIRRSIRLAAGTRYFYVQIKPTGFDTVCAVNDWHFDITAHTSS